MATSANLSSHFVGQNTLAFANKLAHSSFKIERNHLSQDSTDPYFSVNPNNVSFVKELTYLRGEIEMQKSQSLECSLQKQNEKKDKKEQSPQSEHETITKSIDDSESYSICKTKPIITKGTSLTELLYSAIPDNVKKVLIQRNVQYLTRLYKVGENYLLNYEIYKDIQDLLFCNNVLQALDNAYIFNSILNIKDQSRYVFDLAYMPFVYLLLVKSLYLKKKLKGMGRACSTYANDESYENYLGDSDASDNASSQAYAEYSLNSSANDGFVTDVLHHERKTFINCCNKGAHRYQAYKKSQGHPTSSTLQSIARGQSFVCSQAYTYNLNPRSIYTYHLEFRGRHNYCLIDSLREFIGRCNILIISLDSLQKALSKIQRSRYL